MDVATAIRSRVSVKEYEPRAVPREQIERLLDLALQAPNHRMTEPVHFRVLGPVSKRAYGEALGERKAAKIEDADAASAVREKVLRRHLEVPSMVAVVMDEAEDPEVREEDYATAFMAIQNLCLAAVAMGLGTHIKTGAVMGEPSLRAALRVGEGQRLVAIVFLGVPSTQPASKSRAGVASRAEWLE